MTEIKNDTDISITPKRKQDKSFRGICLREHIGETCTFLGRIKRCCKATKDNDYSKNTLLSPLYVNIGSEWKFIDHVWVELPNDISSKKEYVLLFDGSVIKYDHSNNKEGFGIEFFGTRTCEPCEESYYHGIKMRMQESNSDSRSRRRKVNNNLAIIAAYENGVDLDPKHSYKGKQKELERQKILTEQVCKKEYFSDMEHQLNPIIIQERPIVQVNSNEVSKTENRSIVMLKKLFKKVSRMFRPLKQFVNKMASL